MNTETATNPAFIRASGVFEMKINLKSLIMMELYEVSTKLMAICTSHRAIPSMAMTYMPISTASEAAGSSYPITPERSMSPSAWTGRLPHAG